jgi:hypothetical protein
MFRRGQAVLALATQFLGWRHICLMTPSRVSVGPLRLPMAVALAVKTGLTFSVVGCPLNYRPRSPNPGWSSGRRPSGQ